MDVLYSNDKVPALQGPFCGMLAYYADISNSHLWPKKRPSASKILPMTEGEINLVQREEMVQYIAAVANYQDKAAFEKLFRHFAPRIKAFIQGGGFDANVAEEVVQETMINVWRKAKQFDPKKAAVSTWIFTIARNARIDQFRRSNRPEPDMNDPAFVPNPEPQPQEIISREQEARLLSNMLETLPKEQGDVLKLAFFEEKSHMAVSEELGIPLGTVKSRIRLALGRIRSELGRIQ